MFPGSVNRNRSFNGYTITCSLGSICRSTSGTTPSHLLTFFPNFHCNLEALPQQLFHLEDFQYSRELQSFQHRHPSNPPDLKLTSTFLHFAAKVTRLALSAHNWNLMQTANEILVIIAMIIDRNICYRIGVGFDLTCLTVLLFWKLVDVA